MGFRELGERVDTTTTAHGRADGYLKAKMQEGAKPSDFMKITVDGSWADGGAYLNSALKDVLDDYAGDMLKDAMDILRKRMTDAQAEMAAAMRGDATKVEANVATSEPMGRAAVQGAASASVKQGSRAASK